MSREANPYLDSFECPRCGHCCQAEVNKDMKHIKTWHERCEEHPDHQERIISERMIQARMQEEIDELRQALETKREWVGLTAYEIQEIHSGNQHWGDFACAIEAKLKEKNT